jgi:hypothetical protein
MLRRPGVRAGVEREAELADLDLGAVLEEGRVDADAVEVGAVQRAEVLDLERRALADELGMTAGDRDVVEEDVGVGVAACDRDVGVEEEARALVRAAADDEERGSGRERRDGLLLVGRDHALEAGEGRSELVAEGRRGVRARVLLGQARGAVTLFASIHGRTSCDLTA